MSTTCKDCAHNRRRAKAYRVRAWRDRVQATYDRATARSALAACQAPDATLRMMVDELLQDVQQLADDKDRIRGELLALISLVGE